jgi:tetratricopeptide (TPR) repeat protein
VYREALKLSNRHDKKEEGAHSLIQMAYCYHKDGRYPKALQLLTRAYDFANEEDRRNCTGWLCETVDNLLKAMWHPLAWTSTVNQLTPDPTTPIFAFNKAGLILYNANQFRSALSAFNYALQLLSTYQKEEDVEHAKVYIFLAVTHQQLQQYDQALPYFLRAIVLGCEKLGIEDPEVAQWVDQASSCLKVTGGGRRALEVRTSILNELRRLGGAQHALVKKMEQM